MIPRNPTVIQHLFLGDNDRIAPPCGQCKKIHGRIEISILDEFESNDSEAAFVKGDFYIKVHGECGWISKSGEAYRRNQTIKAGFQDDFS